MTRHPTDPDPGPRTGTDGDGFPVLSRRTRAVLVAGWLTSVAVTLLVAGRAGWSLALRPGARLPWFMIIPTLVYWPTVALLVWRSRARHDR